MVLRQQELSEKASGRVKIVEVGARDGLQNIKASVPTETKVELVRRLRETGLTHIELTSVVSPKAIPQLADCRAVLGDHRVQGLIADDSLSMPVLVPNLKGLQIALGHGVREVAVFISATEGFSKANINCSVDEGLVRAKVVTQEARRAGVKVRGYVSCVFADPFDGPTPASAVVRVVHGLLEMGCYEVSLGDTLGVGTPPDVAHLLSALRDSGVSMSALAGHFHDTYGQAVANVWKAYECGLRVFDSSVAGLGGCPYCPGARGNVATEDLVYMFSRAGVATGVDEERITKVGQWISQELALSNGSRAGSALLATKSKAKETAPQPTSNVSVDESASFARSRSNLFQAQDSLRALWEMCRLFWQSEHQVVEPMGT